MGSEFFNQVQYGKETTKGTPVAATQMWIGQMQPIKTDRKPAFPKEHFGVRADSFRSVTHQYLYENTLSTEHGAFQHLPFLFSSLKGGVTPAEQTGGQGDYLWAFGPSMTASNSPDAFTLRFGDDVQAWISEYCMVRKIRISGQIAQGADASPVRLEAEVFGRQIATTSFTGGLSPRTLEPLNAKLARFYLDTSWAGVGGTEIDNVLRSFDIEIIPGVHPKFAGSTSKTFNAHSEGVLAVMGSFTIEGGSDANSFFSAQQSGTFKVGRLNIGGSAIGTGDNYNLSIDWGGVFEDVTPISGSDQGDNLSTFVLKGYADPSSSFDLLDVNLTTNHNSY